MKKKQQNLPVKAKQNEVITVNQEKTTTLDIKAASVEYAIQSNNLKTLEFSSILSENKTPKDLDK